MVINEIHIENIKGLRCFDLNQPIQPNRPNILVAPNGFGKTSLAVAFNSLKSNHLELDGANCYNGDDTNLPVLRLKLSTGESLEADRDNNTISDHFDVFVS